MDKARQAWLQGSPGFLENMSKFPPCINHGGTIRVHWVEGNLLSRKQQICSSYFHKILNLIFNVIFFLYAGYKMWNWWSYFRIPFPLHVIALHFNIAIVKVESLIFKEELWLGDDTNIPLISLKISYNHCILKCRRHPIRFCILIFQKSDIETFNFECLESISDVYSQSLNILLILIK